MNWSRPRSVIKRVFTAVVGLAIAAFLLIEGSINLGPAVSASQGHGIHGFFVAQAESCDNNGGCTWTGEFKLPDGTVTRTGVRFVGSDPSMREGTVVPALDTGGHSRVYQASSSAQWIEPAVLLVLGLLFLAGFVLSQVRRLRGQAGGILWRLSGRSYPG
jgi:hypothetical protein